MTATGGIYIKLAQRFKIGAGRVCLKFRDRLLEGFHIKSARLVTHEHRAHESPDSVLINRADRRYVRTVDNDLHLKLIGPQPASQIFVTVILPVVAVRGVMAVIVVV